MIKLNEEQEKYIDEYNNGSIIIGGKKYYFKLIPSMSYGLEIVAEHLANLAGIKCAHYEVVTINDLNYYLSLDLGQDKNYASAYELGFFDNSLYNIWNELELRYPDNKEYIMQEIVKIFMFDILLLNDDRNYGNYGFIIDGNKLKDVYILDNESILQSGEVVLSSKLEYGDKLNSETNVKIPERLEESINELDYFLQTSSSEYYDIFKGMYDKLTPDVVKNELDNVGINYQSKIDLINIYKENYALIGELLQKRGLK